MSMSLTDFVSIHRDDRKIAVGEAGIDLAAWAGHAYVVEWDRLATPLKCLEFVLHLADKDWATSLMLRDLTEAAARHYGWNLYGA